MHAHDRVCLCENRTAYIISLFATSTFPGLTTISKSPSAQGFLDFRSHRLGSLPDLLRSTGSQFLTLFDYLISLSYFLQYDVSMTKPYFVFSVYDDVSIYAIT